MEDKFAAIFAVLEHFAESANDTGAAEYLKNLHGPAMTTLINGEKLQLAGDWMKRFEPPANDVVAQLRAQVNQLKMALETNTANGVRDAIVDGLRKEVDALVAQVAASTKKPAGGSD